MPDNARRQARLSAASLLDRFIERMRTRPCHIGAHGHFAEAAVLRLPPSNLSLLRARWNAGEFFGKA